MNANGLNPDFTGWGARFPTAPLKSGNGFLFFNTPLQNGFSIQAVNEDLATTGSLSVLRMGDGMRFVKVDGNRDLVQNQILDLQDHLPTLSLEPKKQANLLNTSSLKMENGIGDPLGKKGFIRLFSGFELSPE